jgi:hypothetical protein
MYMLPYMSKMSSFTYNLVSNGVVTGVRVMVFNDTFNNISAISWKVYWSRKLEHVTNKLHDIMLYLVLLAMIWM